MKNKNLFYLMLLFILLFLIINIDGCETKKEEEKQVIERVDCFNFDLNEKNKCEQLNGVYKGTGFGNYCECVITYQDGGKLCRDGSECQSGRCVLKNNEYGPGGVNAFGGCDGSSSVVGCYTEVNNGVVEVGINNSVRVLCVD